MIENCYIRVDANSTIGTGHLVRTEILADKLAEKNINICFICNTVPENYQRKLILKNYKVLNVAGGNSELNQIMKIVTETTNNILIIDSDKEEFYSEIFQTKIRKTGTKLMMITFYNKYHYYADIILNQNIMALSQKYSCEDYTLKLLGPENVILNNAYRNILQNPEKYKTHLRKKTVLITFGGVDKPNRTSLVYRILVNLKNKPEKIIIVLGAMYKFRKEIEESASKTPVNTEIYQNTPEMPCLLAESDIVFNSGGLTVWEAGVLKSLNVITGFTERENVGGKFLGNDKLGIYLGDVSILFNPDIERKIETILQHDNSEIINNLFSKIDVNGIYNVVNAIIRI
ncbi:MAG: hypothetical protein GXO80_01200 [Chlorobi bacterium]|nr:hypothetical protein [Chlorobiota bacterium]